MLLNFKWIPAFAGMTEDTGLQNRVRLSGFLLSQEWQRIQDYEIG